MTGIAETLKPYDVIGKLTYGKLYSRLDLPNEYYFFRYNNGFIVLGGPYARKTLVADLKRVRTKKASKELTDEFYRHINTVDTNTRFVLCGRIPSMFIDAESHYRIFGSENALVTETYTTE